MRNWWILMLGVTACGRSAASTPGDVADEAALKAEIMRVQHEWVAAFPTHDTATIGRSITEDFTAAGPDGPPEGRSELMKGLGDTNVKITNAGIEDVNVRLYGAGTVGVVTGQVRATTQVGSKTSNLVQRYTEVFVKNPQGWQAVAGHWSNLAPPAEPKK